MAAVGNVDDLEVGRKEGVDGSAALKEESTKAVDLGGAWVTRSRECGDVEVEGLEVTEEGENVYVRFALFV